MTTAAVFIPIIGWQDEVGELLRDVAIAIALAVIVSLIVSVFAIPSFSAKLLRPLPEGGGSGAVARMGGAIRGLITRQVAFLAKSWRRGLLVVVAAVTGSVALAGALLPAMEYLPTGNRNLIFGIQLPPPGYSPDELSTIAVQIQGDMAEHTGVDKDGVPSIHRTFFVGDPNRVIFGAVAEDYRRVGKLVPYVQGVGSQAPGAFAFASQASLFGRSIGGSRAVDVEISGNDLQQLIGLGGQMMGATPAQAPRRPGAADPLARPGRARGPRGATARRGGRARRVRGGARAAHRRVHRRRRRRRGRTGGRAEDRRRAPSAAARRHCDRRSGGARGRSRRHPLGGDRPDVVARRRGGAPRPAQIQRIERRRAITLQVSPPQDIPLESAMDTIATRSWRT